jgi:hypothetical protein
LPPPILSDFFDESFKNKTNRIGMQETFVEEKSPANEKWGFFSC